MPKEHEGQHLITAERLCSPKDGTVLLEKLTLELFLLSNNFTFQEQYDDGLTFSKSTSLYNERIMGILERSGMNTLLNFRPCSLWKRATATAEAEKLFTSALRSNDLEIIRMMLKAGMNPNILVKTPKSSYPLTPLELAANISDKILSVRMARLLLSYGGQINRGRGPLSALCYAMSLKLAIDTTDILMLLDAGADVNAKITSKVHFDNGMTALCMAINAIDAEGIMLVEMLLAADANVNAKVSARNNVLLRHDSAPHSCKKQESPINTNAACQRCANVDAPQRWSGFESLRKRTTALAANGKNTLLELAAMQLELIYTAQLRSTSKTPSSKLSFSASVSSSSKNHSARLNLPRKIYHYGQPSYSMLNNLHPSASIP
ncbi:hypothetical protein B0O99DRAFT_747867 [Bisporella sp. PMI_857]|nr:hypothetical protein B0O99DRAFT_747867 [Bisporella sp. PMI_857]